MIERSIWSRLIFLKDRREWFNHVRSFVKIEKIERSKIEERKIEILKYLKIKRSNSQPCQLLLWSGCGIWSAVFWSNQSFFVIKRSIWLWKRSNRSRQSFLKIDGIELLTVNLIKRSMRAILSRSIFLEDRQEQFNHGRSFLKIEKIKDWMIEFSTLVCTL